MQNVDHREKWALIFAIGFPTLLTWTYFVLLAGNDSALQQVTYATGKIIQFAFPLAWVALVIRERVRPARPRAAGLVTGLAFGLLVFAGMYALYVFVFERAAFFAAPAQSIRGKIIDLHIDTIWKYAAVSVFYSVFHSLLEEYYWRWFVFGRLRRLMPFRVALLVASLGFMAHHVVLLATFFGWDSAATYLLAIAIAAGGAVWAWLYERTGSLYGPWLSHLVVDAAIFIIGYDVAAALLRAGG